MKDYEKEYAGEDYADKEVEEVAEDNDEDFLSIDCAQLYDYVEGGCDGCPYRGRC